MILLIKSGETKFTTIFLKTKVFLLIIHDNVHSEKKKVMRFGDTVDEDIPFFAPAPGGDRGIPLKTNKHTSFRKFDRIHKTPFLLDALPGRRRDGLLPLIKPGPGPGSN